MLAISACMTTRSDASLSSIADTLCAQPAIRGGNNKLVLCVARRFNIGGGKKTSRMLQSGFKITLAEAVRAMMLSKTPTRL